MDSKYSLEFRNFDKALNSFICMEVFWGLGFTKCLHITFLSCFFMQDLLTEKQMFFSLKLTY